MLEFIIGTLSYFALQWNALTPYAFRTPRRAPQPIKPDRDTRQKAYTTTRDTTSGHHFSTVLDDGLHSRPCYAKGLVLTGPWFSTMFAPVS